ncbi:MAG: peptidase, partial [Verrucomicrobia bacterium]|nr:peptidase [Verrucomicrobiota bacterium]
MSLTSAPTALAIFLSLGLAAQAQNNPRMGYIYPAGGRQGASFQVVTGGQFLDGATNVFFSGTGVRAAVIEFGKPMTQKEFTLLKDKLKELQDKRAAAFKAGGKRKGQNGAQAAAKVSWTPEDEKMITEIRNKILKNPPNRFANPAIAETVVLQVTMAPDAPPGPRELRLGTPLGLSNPLVFEVGQLPEFSQRAANFRDKTAGLGKAKKVSREQQSSPSNPELSVTLPAVVNGQIMPGAVDRIRFNARAGQQLVIAAKARELIPYLPDAVPGWFQAALTLYDAKGKEVAFADHRLFHPDPVLHYEVPKEGEYALEIRDSIYRGREDFVYRITLGELPFVTSFFPLGGQAGTQPTVELAGWNLPVSKLAFEAKQPGIQAFSAGKDERVSNRIPFAVDTLPECLEQEPNNQPAGAQAVTLPIIINGRIDQPGDWDIFRFEGRAGSEIVAEVYARRLDSPLDSVLKLTDAAGKQLALNDDHEDKGLGLNTHHADSWLRATLPANGTYYLHLGDAQHQGGPEYGYRLRVSPPRPDFELRVVPSSINARGGGTVPIPVYALRKDGFSNEIALALKDAPRGFSLQGGTVPANQDQVRLTLSVPSMPQQEPFTLAVEGRALVQGQELTRPAVPAEDMMQAFAYRHLVPAQDLKVAVVGRYMAKTLVRILSESPARIPSGGTARVRMGTPTSAFTEKYQLELSEPPDG